MSKIKVTRKQYNAIKFAYRIIGFILVVSLLFVFSLLIHKPIEFLLIFLPYFATKGFYCKQWHSDSMKECLLLSVGLFVLAVCITLPKYFSIVFSLCFGLTIAYLTCKAGIIKFKLEDYEYIEPRYNKLVDWYKQMTTPKPFHTDNCSLEQLLERCKELHFSQENTELAIEFFINKTKQSEIAENLAIEETSVAIKKFRLKQKLNKISKL